jgi:hypothetical protein
MCVCTYDDGICECECTGPIVITAGRRRLSLYARVAVDTGEVSLARLGEVLWVPKTRLRRESGLSDELRV